MLTSLPDSVDAGNAASTDGDADRTPTYTDGTKLHLPALVPQLRMELTRLVTQSTSLPT